MRIGVFIGDASGARTDLAALLARARWAEEAGFATGWVPHIPWSLDALTALAVVGQATSRMELGAAVVPTYPRHPMALAQQASTTNAACDGRLVLGLGPSHAGVIEGMLGLRYERPARHTREYVEVLAQASSLPPRQRLSYEGEEFRVDALLEVPGAVPYPVLVAALAPLMLRVAGEVADGTVTYWADERAIGEHVVPRVTKAAEDAGRPRPRVVAGIPVAVVAAAEVDAARERAATVFRAYEAIPAYRRVLALGDHASPGSAALVGTESEVATRLRAFADAGATDFLAASVGLGTDAAASRSRTEEFLADMARQG